MQKTKIDWCDMSWNPVTGCLHGCEYCYARKIANRFKGSLYQNKVYAIQNCNVKLYSSTGYGWYQNHSIDKPVKNGEGRIIPYPFDFKPTFHRYRLDEPQKVKKPQTVFVCSMADLFGKWVPDSWIEAVFEACEKVPQHRYLFLTKNPRRYGQSNLCHMFQKQNIWLGTTITSCKDEYRAKWLLAVTIPDVNTFLSIEPIAEPLNIKIGSIYPHNKIKWVIVGAETGNRKGKVIPKKEWIMTIKEQCKEAGVPLFMKESLRELMGNDFVQEFPW